MGWAALDVLGYDTGNSALALLAVASPPSAVSAQLPNRHFAVNSRLLIGPPTPIRNIALAPSAA